MAKKVESIAIIGGGFTGAVLAVQLSRVAPRPLDITIVEPRPNLGRGLAHSTPHPDHRLNAPAQIHSVFPDEPDHFFDWLTETGAIEEDPESVDFDGAVYPRRRAYGTYIGALLNGHTMFNPTSSRINHARDAAVELDKEGTRFKVTLRKGAPISADAVALATSNERPSPPGPFAQFRHPAFVANPWRLDYRKVPKNARVLIIGTGLTSADIIASLLRTGHAGPIEAVSRHGLAPTRRWSDGTPKESIWESFAREVPIFVERHGMPGTVGGLLRALRRDIEARLAAGSSWQPAFDELRDAAVVLWPNLPLDEKRRFMRHLRSWYEAHRFRLPPPLEPILDGATERGQLTMGQAHIEAARPSKRNDGKMIEVTLARPDGTRSTETFTVVINCTGPEQNPARAHNPLIRDLLRKGMARPHPCGLGLAVDQKCRVIGRDGGPHLDFYAFGLLTRGTFGESTSVAHIAWQIMNNVGDMVGA